MWWRSVPILGIIFGVILFIIPNIAWLVSWIAAKCFSFRMPYMPFCYTGIGLVIILWILLIYGHYFGRFEIEVNNIEYASKDVPAAFKGYRIVHISDLHVDSFDSHPEALQKFIDKVNAQNADIILFTGDMTTNYMKNIPLHEKALKSLHAKEGVVSILGNHDFFIYCYQDRVRRLAAADSLTDYERNTLGWTVLRNSSLLLHRGNDSIAIAGVDNINGKQGFKTIQMGDLKKAMTGLDGIFTVLMTHDPSHWQAEVLPKSHAQITLSGHTHAAQARLFGWSFAHFSFKECDGRYDEDGRMLYVNAGTGCTAPFRIFCPSEITVITLK